MRPDRIAVLLLAAATLGGFASAARPAEDAATVTSVDLPDAAAVVREARYKMSAAIRPLYVFWIRAGNVGAGRILWREGDGGFVTAALLPNRPRCLLSGVQTTFTFNASLYELRLRSTEWEESATYGGRRYERLVRLSCEHFNREKKTRERFVLMCAAEGPLARVPVLIEYQPKWWFKAQGVLDDSEVFP
jgi:hypothetical protein